MHSVTLFTEDGIDSGADVVAAGEEGGARRGADRRSGMEVGEAHALGGQLVEDRGLDWTAVTANVSVAEVVDKQSDDVRVFVLGKTGTNKKQEAKKGEEGLHLLLFALLSIRGSFLGVLQDPFGFLHLRRGNFAFFQPFLMLLEIFLGELHATGRFLLGRPAFRFVIIHHRSIQSKFRFRPPLLVMIRGVAFGSEAL